MQADGVSRVKKANALVGMLTSLGWLEDRGWCWGVVSDRSRKSSVDLPGRASDVKAQVVQTRDAAGMRRRQTELTAVFQRTHTEELRQGGRGQTLNIATTHKCPQMGKLRQCMPTVTLVPKARAGYELVWMDMIEQELCGGL